MKSNMRGFVAIGGICLGLMMPVNMTLADSESFNKLSAEWCAMGAFNTHIGKPLTR